MSELDHAHDTGNTPVIRRLLDDTVCEVRDDVFFNFFHKRILNNQTTHTGCERERV